MAQQIDQRTSQPGAAPGIEHDEIVGLAGEGGDVSITCIDYSPENVSVQEVEDLVDFLGRHRPDWSAVRWINVAGLSNLNAIHALATKYDLHPLAIEDVLDCRQRPKIESYGGQDSEFQARLFIVTRLPEIKDGKLADNQISIFVGHSTVLSFQQSDSEIWQPLLLRIIANGSRLRRSDAGFLAYSLLDAVVDSYYAILEHYSEHAEDLEDSIIEHMQTEIIGEIHQLKRDLQLLQRMMWPMREVVSSLQRDPHECISDTSRVYLRDLYDHVVQIMDIIEKNRELASDLTETYMSSLSNRMNEIMKVLSIIGTIFIPLTFLAGVYGMNFNYFPELGYVWAYPVFWVVCILLTTFMLLFRRRKWL
jgi:magnesium transporter